MIIPVHLYGYPAEMDEIMEIAEERGIIVVEDAAQAHGAQYRGRKTGSLGHTAIFSFYPTKNMTTAGDGGMIVTNDDEIAEKVRKLRDVGRKGRYSHDLIGYTMRLNTVNAAVGRIQLKHLEEWNHRRREIARTYDKILSQLEEVKTPPKPDSNHLPVYHLYVIRVPRQHRGPLGAWLEKNGVEALVHYPIPVHLQPAYKYLGYKGGDLLVTEEWAKTILSIPMYPELTTDQSRYVAELIIEFYSKRLYQDKEIKRKGALWEKKLT